MFYRNMKLTNSFYRNNNKQQVSMLAVDHTLDLQIEYK
jgi:hypothetical protein